MTKKHEELVGELDKLFIEECGNDSLTPYSELDEDDRWVVEEAWDKIITLILSAVCDGRLKLPEEAWRAQAWIEDGHEHFPRGRVEVRPPIGALSDLPRQCAFDVIALQGTGKEEEK